MCHQLLRGKALALLDHITEDVLSDTVGFSDHASAAAILFYAPTEKVNISRMQTKRWRE